MTTIEQLKQQLENTKKKNEKADNELKALKDKKSELAKKERQLARKIESKLSAQKRKERTHRLIQIGGILEQVAGGEIDLFKLENYANQYSRAIENLKKIDIEKFYNSNDT